MSWIQFWLAIAAGMAAAWYAGGVAWKNTRDVFGPSLILVVYLAASYVLDPVWMAAHREYGFNEVLNYSLGMAQLPYLSLVILLGAAATFAFALGIRTLVFDGVFVRLAPGVRRLVDRDVVGRRVWIIVAVSGFASLWALRFAFSTRVTSLLDIIRWAGNKQAVFEGLGYLLLLVWGFKTSVLLLAAAVLARKIKISRVQFLVLASAVFVTMVIDIVAGTRSHLLLSNLLVLVVLYHRLRRRIDLKRVLLIYFPLAASLFVGIRVFTRDIFFSFSSGKTPFQVAAEKIEGIGQTILYDEFQSADTQLLVMRGHAGHDAPLYGSTIAAAAVIPVPRAIYPDKPRGASAWFTSRFFPIRYEVTRVELVSSLLTEFWLNFRVPGVVVGFFLLGAFVGAFERHGPEPGNPLLDTAFAIVAWRFVSLVRGDFYTWVVIIASTFVPLVVNFWLMSKPKRAPENVGSADVALPAPA